MICRICVGLIALAVAVSAAQACRVPVDPVRAREFEKAQLKETEAEADVVVKGRLIEARKPCETGRHCGQWIQTVRVGKGQPAPYYLISAEELLITCTRQYVKPGRVGIFHLQAKADGTYLIVADIR